MYLYLNAKRRKLWKLIVLENAQVARVHNTILLECHNFYNTFHGEHKIIMAVHKGIMVEWEV